MAEATIRFDDSHTFERLMGRWSRAVAPVFIDWLAAATGARALMRAVESSLPCGPRGAIGYHARGNAIKAQVR